MGFCRVSVAFRRVPDSMFKLLLFLNLGLHEGSIRGCGFTVVVCWGGAGFGVQSAGVSGSAVCA